MIRSPTTDVGGSTEGSMRDVSSMKERRVLGGGVPVSEVNSVALMVEDENDLLFIARMLTTYCPKMGMSNGVVRFEEGSWEYCVSVASDQARTGVVGRRVPCKGVDPKVVEDMLTRTLKGMVTVWSYVVAIQDMVKANETSDKYRKEFCKHVDEFRDCIDKLNSCSNVSWQARTDARLEVIKCVFTLHMLLHLYADRFCGESSAKLFTKSDASEPVINESSSHNRNSPWSNRKFCGLYKALSHFGFQVHKTKQVTKEGGKSNVSKSTMERIIERLGECVNDAMSDAFSEGDVESYLSTLKERRVDHDRRAGFESTSHVDNEIEHTIWGDKNSLRFAPSGHTFATETIGKSGGSSYLSGSDVLETGMKAKHKMIELLYSQDESPNPDDSDGDDHFPLFLAEGGEFKFCGDSSKGSTLARRLTRMSGTDSSNVRTTCRRTATRMHVEGEDRSGFDKRQPREALKESVELAEELEAASNVLRAKKSTSYRLGEATPIRSLRSAMMTGVEVDVARDVERVGYRAYSLSKALDGGELGVMMKSVVVISQMLWDDGAVSESKYDSKLDSMSVSPSEGTVIEKRVLDVFDAFGDVLGLLLGVEESGYRVLMMEDYKLAKDSAFVSISDFDMTGARCCASDGLKGVDVDLARHAWKDVLKRRGDSDVEIAASSHCGLWVREVKTEGLFGTATAQSIAGPRKLAVGIDNQSSLYCARCLPNIGAIVGTIDDEYGAVGAERLILTVTGQPDYVWDMNRRSCLVAIHGRRLRDIELRLTLLSSRRIDPTISEMAWMREPGSYTDAFVEWQADMPFLSYTLDDRGNMAYFNDRNEGDMMLTCLNRTSIRIKQLLLKGCATWQGVNQFGLCKRYAQSEGCRSSVSIAFSLLDDLHKPYYNADEFENLHLWSRYSDGMMFVGYRNVVSCCVFIRSLYRKLGMCSPDFSTIMEGFGLPVCLLEDPTVEVSYLTNEGFDWPDPTIASFGDTAVDHSGEFADISSHLDSVSSAASSSRSKARHGVQLKCDPIESSMLRRWVSRQSDAAQEEVGRCEVAAGLPLNEIAIEPTNKGFSELTYLAREVARAAASQIRNGTSHPQSVFRKTCDSEPILTRDHERTPERPKAFEPGEVVAAALSLKTGMTSRKKASIDDVSRRKEVSRNSAELAQVYDALYCANIPARSNSCTYLKDKRTLESMTAWALLMKHYGMTSRGDERLLNTVGLEQANQEGHECSFLKRGALQFAMERHMADVFELLRRENYQMKSESEVRELVLRLVVPRSSDVSAVSTTRLVVVSVTDDGAEVRGLLSCINKCLECDDGSRLSFEYCAYIVASMVVEECVVRLRKRDDLPDHVRQNSVGVLETGSNSKWLHMVNEDLVLRRGESLGADGHVDDLCAHADSSFFASGHKFPDAENKEGGRVWMVRGVLRNHPCVSASCERDVDTVKVMKNRENVESSEGGSIEVSVERVAKRREVALSRVQAGCSSYDPSASGKTSNWTWGFVPKEEEDESTFRRTPRTMMRCSDDIVVAELGRASGFCDTSRWESPENVGDGVRETSINSGVILQSNRSMVSDSEDIPLSSMRGTFDLGPAITVGKLAFKNALTGTEAGVGWEVTAFKERVEDDWVREEDVHNPNSEWRKKRNVDYEDIFGRDVWLDDLIVEVADGVNAISFTDLDVNKFHSEGKDLHDMLVKSSPRKYDYRTTYAKGVYEFRRLAKGERQSITKFLDATVLKDVPEEEYETTDWRRHVRFELVMWARPLDRWGDGSPDPDVSDSYTTGTGVEEGELISVTIDGGTSAVLSQRTRIGPPTGVERSAAGSSTNCNIDDLKGNSLDPTDASASLLGEIPIKKFLEVKAHYGNRIVEVLGRCEVECADLQCSGFGTTRASCRAEGLCKEALYDLSGSGALYSGIPIGTVEKLLAFARVTMSDECGISLPSNLRELVAEHVKMLVIRGYNVRLFSKVEDRSATGLSRISSMYKYEDDDSTCDVVGSSDHLHVDVESPCATVRDQKYVYDDQSCAVTARWVMHPLYEDNPFDVNCMQLVTPSQSSLDKFNDMSPTFVLPPVQVIAKTVTNSVVVGSDWGSEEGLSGTVDRSKDRFARVYEREGMVNASVSAEIDKGNSDSHVTQGNGVVRQRGSHEVISSEGRVSYKEGKAMSSLGAAGGMEDAIELRNAYERHAMAHGFKIVSSVHELTCQDRVVVIPPFCGRSDITKSGAGAAIASGCFGSASHRRSIHRYTHYACYHKIRGFGVTTTNRLGGSISMVRLAQSIKGDGMLKGLLSGTTADVIGNVVALPSFEDRLGRRTVMRLAKGASTALSSLPVYHPCEREIRERIKWVNEERRSVLRSGEVSFNGTKGLIPRGVGRMIGSFMSDRCLTSLRGPNSNCAEGLSPAIFRTQVVRGSVQEERLLLNFLCTVVHMAADNVDNMILGSKLCFEELRRSIKVDYDGESKVSAHFRSKVGDGCGGGKSHYSIPKLSASRCDINGQPTASFDVSKVVVMPPMELLNASILGSMIEVLKSSVTGLFDCSQDELELIPEDGRSFVGFKDDRSERVLNDGCPYTAKKVDDERSVEACKSRVMSLMSSMYYHSAPHTLKEVGAQRLVRLKEMLVEKYVLGDLMRNVGLADLLPVESIAIGNEGYFGERMLFEMETDKLRLNEIFPFCEDEISYVESTLGTGKISCSADYAHVKRSRHMFLSDDGTEWTKKRTVHREVPETPVGIGVSSSSACDFNIATFVLFGSNWYERGTGENYDDDDVNIKRPTARIVRGKHFHQERHQQLESFFCKIDELFPNLRFDSRSGFKELYVWHCISSGVLEVEKAVGRMWYGMGHWEDGIDESLDQSSPTVNTRPLGVVCRGPGVGRVSPNVDSRTALMAQDVLRTSYGHDPNSVIGLDSHGRSLNDIKLICGDEAELNKKIRESTTQRFEEMITYTPKLPSCSPYQSPDSRRRRSHLVGVHDTFIIVRWIRLGGSSSMIKRVSSAERNARIARMAPSEYLASSYNLLRRQTVHPSEVHLAAKLEKYPSASLEPRIGKFSIITSSQLKDQSVPPSASLTDRVFCLDSDSNIISILKWYVNHAPPSLKGSSLNIGVLDINGGGESVLRAPMKLVFSGGERGVGVYLTQLTSVDQVGTCLDLVVGRRSCEDHIQEFYSHCCKPDYKMSEFNHISPSVGGQPQPAHTGRLMVKTGRRLVVKRKLEEMGTKTWSDRREVEPWFFQGKKLDGQWLLLPHPSSGPERHRKVVISQNVNGIKESSEKWWITPHRGFFVHKPVVSKKTVYSGLMSDIMICPVGMFVTVREGMGCIEVDVTREVSRSRFDNSTKPHYMYKPKKVQRAIFSRCRKLCGCNDSVMGCECNGEGKKPAGRALITGVVVMSNIKLEPETIQRHPPKKSISRKTKGGGGQQKVSIQKGVEFVAVSSSSCASGSGRCLLKLDKGGFAVIDAASLYGHVGEERKFQLTPERYTRLESCDLTVVGGVSSLPSNVISEHGEDPLTYSQGVAVNAKKHGIGYDGCILGKVISEGEVTGNSYRDEVIRMTHIYMTLRANSYGVMRREEYHKLLGEMKSQMCLKD